jgi:hypothetical protein
VRGSTSSVLPPTLVPDLLNRLSVIVGNCELTIEKAQHGCDGSANHGGLVARLSATRNVAESAALDLRSKKSATLRHPHRDRSREGGRLENSCGKEPRGLSNSK